MQNRFIDRRSSRKRLIGVVTGAAGCVVVIAGCSSGPANSSQPAGSLPTTTAQITVNGKLAGTTHDIQCSQDGWSHTIQTGDEKSGVTLVVDTGDVVSAKSVVLTNVGGFTGSVWAENLGKAEAAIIGTTFKVTGTADGATTDDPNQRATATFEIRANC